MADKKSSWFGKPTNQESPSQKSSSPVTRIKVKYDCGFSNEFFLRGKGISNLSWDKGTRLKNVKSDEWVWETNQPFNECEFKVLINDKEYELGANHVVHQGETVEFRPHFQ